MDVVVSWLKDAGLSDLTIQFAQIVIPVLVAYLMGMALQGSRWLSAQLKANMTIAQLNVLNAIADIAVDAAKVWLENNKVPLPWSDETTPESVTKFNERAIQEFEAIRQQKGVPMVDTLTTRALVSHSIEKNRRVPFLDAITIHEEVV